MSNGYGAMDRKIAPSMRDGPINPTSLGRVTSDELSSTSAAAASAPKDESLYESLIRYHEDDSDDDNSVQQNGVAAELIGDDDDRKPAAKPMTKVVQRPPISRPYSNRNNETDRPSSKRMDNEKKEQSFYESALAAAQVEGTPAEPGLFPPTSSLDSADNFVPKEFEDDIPSESLMTADSRRAVPPVIMDDDLLAIQQVSVMSLKDAPVVDVESDKPKDEEIEEDPQKQAELWEKIMEERERKQLEEALRESKMASGGGTVDFVPNTISSEIPREFLEEHLASERAQTNHALSNTRNNRPRPPTPPRRETPPAPQPPDVSDLVPSAIPRPSPRREIQPAPPPPKVSDLAPSAIPPRESPADFLISQQMAMEEWRTMQGPKSRSASAGATPHGSRTPQSSGFVPPQQSVSVANDELLRQGHRETREAISNGTAHVVQCRGCLGRLHAPMSYALVFCPNCKTVSPGQTYTSTPPPRDSERKRPKEPVEKSDSFRRRSNPHW